MAHEILIEIDSSVKMARVSLDGEGIMEGNFWDFHPGTHGITKYGKFNSHHTLAGAIYSTLVRSGVPYNHIKTTRKEYDWKSENYYNDSKSSTL
jgi:hypothetical protein